MRNAPSGYLARAVRSYARNVKSLILERTKRLGFPLSVQPTLQVRTEVSQMWVNRQHSHGRLGGAPWNARKQRGRLQKDSA